MKKNKLFVACDTTNINKIKKIINETQSSKLKVGYKFGLEFLNSKNGRTFEKNKKTIPLWRAASQLLLLDNFLNSACFHYVLLMSLFLYTRLLRRGLKPVFPKLLLNLCVNLCFRLNVCICACFASDRVSASRAPFLQRRTQFLKPPLRRPRQVYRGPGSSQSLRSFV